MKKLQRVPLTIVLVLAGAFAAVFIYSRFFDKPQVVTVKEEQPVQYASLPSDSGAQGSLPDLTYAAEKSVPAVVHVMTRTVMRGWSNAPGWFGFGYRYRQQQPEVEGFGSGVILSPDGYIVTNNHVIEDAQEIKVVLNDKREFTAKLVGTDPNTDVALLKIDADNLPYLEYGDASKLKLGEWVLAVGNPFNLTSTVTAGIISAKARNLDMDPNNQLSIESYIQTDAAVNPGNSGGALVNQQGQLVGINAAIASQTGSYSGYSFAVPVSIVKKVVNDLKEFGTVQRAMLGVSIQTINAELAKEHNLNTNEGVYVASVQDNSAAKEAGIKEGDIILSVAGTKVNSAPELQEKVSQYRPGDDVTVVVKRKDSEKQFNVTLRNRNGNTQIVRDNEKVLGAMFEQISNRDKQRLQIDNGIKITKLDDGKLKDAGLKEGFIITSVNKKPIYAVDDFKKEIGNARGGILIEGVYPTGETAYFAFSVS